MKRTRENSMLMTDKGEVGGRKKILGDDKAGKEKERGREKQPLGKRKMWSYKNTEEKKRRLRDYEVRDWMKKCNL